MARLRPALIVVALALLAPNARAGAAAISLTIDTSKGRHAISDDVYGLMMANEYDGTHEDEALERELSIPVERHGGNANSLYNWKNDFINHGNDYFFENSPNYWEDHLKRHVDPDSDGIVADNLKHSTRTVVTVPAIGWVAKDSPKERPWYCSYPDTKFPAQTEFDQYQTGPRCGNGHPVTDPGGYYDADPTDVAIAVGPEWGRDYAAHNVKVFGSGTVPFYSLDNEPDLWNATHHDVAPANLNYEQYVNRAVAWAKAVKQGDPKAQVLAPVVSGWCALFFSFVDGPDKVGAGCQEGPDRRAHGNLEFLRYFLRQMKAKGDGERLLDYLDVHYYPQADNPTPGAIPKDEEGTPLLQAQRLRSTRSLWDPAYKDESWIGHDLDAEPIRLIPRLREWIAAEYPGTKLAITEYYFGARGTMNGALAQADVLGILGREGVDMAHMWSPPTTAQPAAYAFRMYRNYDSKGGRFGDTSVSAVSGDQGQLAVYASVRSSDGALTAIVVNKTGSAISAPLALTGFTPTGPAKRFTYSGTNLKSIVADNAINSDASGWTASYPASSITLVVVPGPPLPSVAGTGSATGTKTTPRPGQTPAPGSSEATGAGQSSEPALQGESPGAGAEASKPSAGRRGGSAAVPAVVGGLILLAGVGTTIALRRRRG